MTVGVGFHDDAELRGSDKPPQILNVLQKGFARDENLNVMLSHRHLLRRADGGAFLETKV